MILRQTPVSDLVVTKHAFDVAEWMLHFRPDTRFGLFEHLLLTVCSQLPSFTWPHRDLPVNLTTQYSAAGLSRLMNAAETVCERDGRQPELVLLRRLAAG